MKCIEKEIMEQRTNSGIYPANLTNLLAASAYHQNAERLASHAEMEERTVYPERYAENMDRSSISPASTLDDGDSSQSAFGVDLTGKGTNLAGKSFTIAAILGLTNAEDDVMNLSVQERLQNQRQLQSYLYAGEMQRLNDGFCRSVVGVPSALRGIYSLIYKLSHV